MHLGVCASSLSAQQSVMGGTKWPVPTPDNFELGMHLPPALQPPISFHWGAVMLVTHPKIQLKDSRNINTPQDATF